MKPEPKQFFSDQEFFDAARNWLIVEKRPRCANPLEAVYREGDLTCVVGAFIPEKLYALNFPNEPIIDLLEAYPEFRAWFSYLSPRLMQAVEEVHNHPDSSLSVREAKMHQVAERFNLCVALADVRNLHNSSCPGSPSPASTPTESDQRRSANGQEHPSRRLGYRCRIRLSAVTDLGGQDSRCQRGDNQAARGASAGETRRR